MNYTGRGKREAVSKQIETLPSLCPPLDIGQNSINEEGEFVDYVGTSPFVVTIPKKAFSNNPHGYGDFSDSLDGTLYKELYHMICDVIHHLRLQEPHAASNVYAFEESLMDDNGLFAGVRWFIFHRRPLIAELALRLMPSLVAEEHKRLESDGDVDDEGNREQIDMAELHEVAKFRATQTIRTEYPGIATILARAIERDDQRLREEADIIKPGKRKFRPLAHKYATEAAQGADYIAPFLQRCSEDLYKTLVNMYTYANHGVDDIFKARGIDSDANIACATSVFSLAVAMIHDTKLVCEEQKTLSNYHDEATGTYRFPKPNNTFRMDHTQYDNPRRNLQYTFTHMVPDTIPDMADLQNHLSSVPDDLREQALVHYKRAQVRFSQQNRPQGLRESCALIASSIQAEMKLEPDNREKIQELRQSAIGELSLLLSDSTHYPISFRSIISFMQKHLQMYHNFNLAIPSHFRDLSVGGNMQAMLTLQSEVLLDVAHLHTLMNSQFQVALYNLLGNDLCSHSAVTGVKGTGKSYVQKLLMTLLLIPDTFQCIGGITTQGMSGGGNQISNAVYFMDDTNLSTFKSADGSVENNWKQVLSNNRVTRLSNQTGNGNGRKAELVITELINTFVINTNEMNMRTLVDEAIANRFDYFHAQITKREDGSAASRTSSYTGPAKKAMIDYLVLSYHITQTLVFLLMLSWKCGANKFPTTYVIDTLWQPFRAIAHHYGLFQADEVRFYERVRHHAIIACCRRVIHLLMFSELRAFDKRVDADGELRKDVDREFRITDLLQFDPYLYVTQQDFVTGLTSISQSLYFPEMEEVLRILPLALFPELDPKMVHGKLDVPMNYRSATPDFVVTRIRVANEHKATDEDILNAIAKIIIDYNQKKGAFLMKFHTVVDFLRYCRGDFPHRNSIFNFGDCPVTPLRIQGVYLHVHKDFLFLAAKRNVISLLKIAMTHPFAREEMYIANVPMDRKPHVLRTFRITPQPINRFYCNGQSDDLVSSALFKLQDEIDRKEERMQAIGDEASAKLELPELHRSARARIKNKAQRMIDTLQNEVEALKQDMISMQANKVMRVMSAETREQQSVAMVTHIEQHARAYFAGVPIHANPVGEGKSVEIELNATPVQVVLRDLDNLAADARLKQIGLTREEVAARPGFPSIVEAAQRIQLTNAQAGRHLPAYTDIFTNAQACLSTVNDIKETFAKGNKIHKLAERKRLLNDPLNDEEKAELHEAGDDLSWVEAELNVVRLEQREADEEEEEERKVQEQEEEDEGMAPPRKHDPHANMDMDDEVDREPGMNVDDSGNSAADHDARPLPSPYSSTSNISMPSSSSSSSHSTRKRGATPLGVFNVAKLKKRLNEARRPPILSLRREVSSNSSGLTSYHPESSSAAGSDSDSVSRMSAPSSPAVFSRFSFLNES